MAMVGTREDGRKAGGGSFQRDRRMPNDNQRVSVEDVYTDSVEPRSSRQVPLFQDFTDHSPIPAQAA